MTLAKWHAIRVTPGRERFVMNELVRRNVLVYLPMTDRVVIMRTARGKHTRVMQFPQLAGYVFIYSLLMPPWGRVLRLRHVHELLRDHWGEPLEISRWFIERLLTEEIDDAVARQIIAKSQIAAESEAPKKAKKPGRRGKRGHKIRKAARRAALTPDSP